MRKTLARWLRTAARRLDPGGEFVMVKMPPVVWAPAETTSANAISHTLRFNIENKGA